MIWNNLNIYADDSYDVTSMMDALRQPNKINLKFFHILNNRFFKKLLFQTLLFPKNSKECLCNGLATQMGSHGPYFSEEHVPRPATGRWMCPPGSWTRIIPMQYVSPPY